MFLSLFVNIIWSRVVNIGSESCEGGNNELKKPHNFDNMQLKHTNNVFLCAECCTTETINQIYSTMKAFTSSCFT